MDQLGTSRPLTARSVIASTLLGTHPPRLSSQLLVRSAELFGIAEGTTRTAISRMVHAGELVADDGSYRLAGALLARQERQDASRRAERRRWRGQWTMAVVSVERRPAPARAALRAATNALRLGELREGVWLRPDNLAAGRAPEAESVLDEQCRWFRVDPDATDGGRALASELWDLDAWAHEAEAWRAELAHYVGPLEAGDASVLAEAFVVSAAVLRQLLADPLLPTGLLPEDWPGDALRADYDRYDVAFKTVWSAAFRGARG